ncbi:MAG: ABC transporter permease [Thermomicrobiales bacterium]|jgi:peptide/nickel transport system permease protein/oligopeptide transport system permease protein|nr:ABC transporter permease [Thermomicrobiales bacterium]
MSAGDLATINPQLPPEATVTTAPSRTWGDRLAPFLANKLAVIGAILTLFFLIVACIGAAIMYVPGWNDLYIDQRLRETLLRPLSPGFPLGTDQFGRDMMWRIAAGTAVSLFTGVAVTVISMFFGMILGAIAGYKGGIIDRLISAIIDLVWGFPVILVAVILVGMLKPGLTAVILAVSLVNWAGFARIVRAQVISLKERAFVEAARALGVPAWKIILRHLIPNMLGTSLVMASYYIAVTVIAEAGLAFIGLGAQPPTPSLGQMISEGRNFLYVNPWVAILPGATIALIVLGLNTLGDGLRDIFDPHLRRW